MILRLKILINIIDPGQLSPHDSAIECCKSKGVHRYCLGDCVPLGAIPERPIRKKYSGIKCSKYTNKTNTCKKGKSY